MSQLTAPIRRLSSMARLGLVVLACAALAIPAFAALGASPAPAGGTGPIGGPASGPGHHKDGGPGHGKGGGPGHGNGGGPGHHITITAIDGAKITLTTEDGWTRTITLGADAAVMSGDVKIAATDLKVGQEVRIRQVRNDDGSFTITELTVVIPHLGGTVTAVGDASLTLKLKDDSTRVITLTGDTTYSVGRKAATKADVTVGADVDVHGTPGSGDAFTAISVHVKLPRLDGIVTAVSGSTITITTGGREGGVKATINVASDTTFDLHPATPGAATSGALKDIAVGMHVHAEGTLNADGSLNAQSVDVHAPKLPKAPPPAP